MVREAPHCRKLRDDYAWRNSDPRVDGDCDVSRLPVDADSLVAWIIRKMSAAE